jgi:hypothetical protein
LGLETVDPIDQSLDELLEAHLAFLALLPLSLLLLLLGLRLAALELLDRGLELLLEPALLRVEFLVEPLERALELPLELLHPLVGILLRRRRARPRHGEHGHPHRLFHLASSKPPPMTALLVVRRPKKFDRIGNLESGIWNLEAFKFQNCLGDLSTSSFQIPDSRFRATPRTAS